jgi:hypothetical protein
MPIAESPVKGTLVSEPTHNVDREYACATIFCGWGFLQRQP